MKLALARLRSALSLPETHSAIEVLEARIAPAAIVWNKNASGFWDDATNWSGGVVPGASDDVTLPSMASAYQVTIRSGAQEVHSLNATAPLNLLGGSLTLDAASSTHGDLTLNGGSLVLNGAFDTYATIHWDQSGFNSTISGTAALTNHGTAELASDLKTLQTTFINAGTFHANGSGLSVSSTGTLQNLASGVINLQGNAQIVRGLVSNAGTLNITSGDSRFDAPLNNTGTVHVIAGSLLLTANGVNSSIFNVDSGAQLTWTASPNGGRYTLAIGTQLNGLGLYDQAGFVNVDVVTGLSISPANLKLEGQFGSSFGGGGTITIKSGAKLDLGSNLGGTDAGQLVIAVGSTIVTHAGASIAHETVKLDGTLSIDNFNLPLSNGAILNVSSGGTLSLLHNASMSGEVSGEALNILSGGTLTVNSPAGTASLGIGGSNNGTIHLLSGDLQLNSTFVHTGVLQADTGSTIEIRGTGNSFLNGAQFLGSGLFKITSTTSLGPGLTISPHALELVGKITGSGHIEIGNGATFTIDGNRVQVLGVLSGTGQVHIAAGGMLTTPYLYLENGWSVINDGTITVHGLRAGLSTSVSSTITNNATGTFNVLPDTDGYTNLLGPVVFANAGTLHLDASGSQGATFDGQLANTGVLSITGGLANLAQSNAGTTSSSAGEFRLDAASTLQLKNNFTFNAGATFTGAGLFNFDNVTVTLATGTTLNAKFLRLNNGEVDGPGHLSAGPGAQWTLGNETLKNLGPWTISSGAVIQSGTNNPNAVTLTGTSVDNSGTINFNTGNGPSFNITDGSLFTNEASGTVNFGTGSYGFTDNGGVIKNLGTITADPGSSTFFHIGSSSVPFNNPGTFILKSGLASFPGPSPQVSADGTQLLGGTWQALNGSAISLPIAIVEENYANVTLSGAGASFDAFRGSIRLNAGTLAVLEGATLTIQTGYNAGVPGSLTNTGTLEIGNAAQVHVTGDYTQSGAGALRLHVGGTAASGRYGTLAIDGAATLDGALQIVVDADPVPAGGNAYPLVTFASVTGAFSSQNGVAPLFLESDFATGQTFTLQGLPSNLLVTGVTIPGSGNAGQNVTVGYTVQNGAAIRTNASHWTDSIYLSTGTTFDAGSATLLGRAVHQGALAGGASYTGSLTAPLPTLLSGDYHVFVVTDSRNEVGEASETDNVLAAPGLLHVNVPVLTFGTPLNGTITSGQDELFRVHLPAGSDHFTLHTAGLGQAEIYVSKGAPPAVNGANFYAFDATSADQEITFAEGGDADYYVLLHGREGAGAGAGFTLSAAALPFSVTSLGTLAATNNGAATLAIHGGQFSSATTFQLQLHGGGSTVLPTRVTLQDGTLEYATFDLTGLPAGDYDLRATDHGTTVTLASSFKVLSAPLADPGVQVILSLSAPARTRIGRPTTILVTYNNLSGHDVPAPLVVLSSDHANFFDGDEQYTQFIEFYALNTGGGDETILPAGYSGTRFLSYQPQTIEPHLNTTLYLNLASTKQALDLGKLQIEGRPSGELTDAEWALVQAQLVTQLGPTYQQYADVLRGDIHLLPEIYGDARSPIDLLAIEVQKAEAAVFTSLHGQLGAAPAGVSLAGGLVLAHNTLTGEEFSTRSLNDGTFTFGRVTPGSYTFAYDEALVTNGTPVTVVAGQHNVAVTLGLAAGGELSGSLGPLVTAGAVLAQAANGTVTAALVDETGHYHFGALPAGLYTLTAEGTGFAPLSLPGFTVAAGANTHDFNLTPEGIISGHVTVHAGPKGSLPLITATGAGGATFSVLASSTGAYSLTGLPAGSYTLAVTEAGYVTAKPAALLTVTSGHTTAAADVPLLVAGTISGAVVGDASVYTGELVGAYLNGVLAGSALAGADGKFSITGLAPGSYTVQPAESVPFSTTRAAVVAEGKTVTGITIGSYAGGSIAGTIHHGTVTGTIFPGATVQATAADGSVRTAIADAQGHYEFDGLAAGTYSVVVQGSTAATGAAKVAVASVQAHPLKDLAASATGHLHGLLSLDGTTPLVGGFVEVLDAAGHVLTSTTTGADGLYSFQLGTTGALTLRAEAETGTFADSTVSVTAGQDVTANLTAGTGALHIPVTDTAGSVAGAEVALIEMSTGQTVTVITLGVNGVADFTHLAPGSYAIYVREVGNRGALVTASVTAGTINAPVALAAQGSLSGHVTGLPTGSGAQVSVTLAGMPGVSFTVPAAADGSYSLANLPSGQYTVTAVSDGLAAPAQKTGVSIASGSNSTDLPLTASGGRLVDGKIVDVNGFPIAGATVQFIDASGNFIGQATATEAGAFMVRLPAGTVHLKIFTKDNAPLDFLGTLQVNLPPTNQPDLPQDFGNLSANFANSSDSNQFDLLYAALDIAGFGKLTNIFKLYDTTKKDAIDVFKKSDDHVNELPNGSACPGCVDEQVNASQAVVKQNALYDKWEYDYHHLVDDAVQGEADIRDEALKNLKTIVDVASFVVGVGELMLEAKAAVAATEAGVAGVETAATVAAKVNVKALAADLANKFNSLASSVFDLINQANQGFQPSDEPNQDAEYVRQLSSSTNSVLSTAANFVDLATNLHGASATLLKKTNVVLGGLDKILNYKSTIEALTYTNSQKSADKVDQDLTKFKGDIDPYQKSATTAHEKKVTLENCLKNNAADARCNPNPGGKNKPIPPDGPGNPGNTGNQTNSADPNSIDAPAGFGPSRYVSAQTPLAYTIHFENMATAEIPAAEVLITQQLDANLDFNTFQLGDFSFGAVHISVPAGHSSYSVHHLDETATLGVFVDFDASVDLHTGMVTWDLRAIDPATGDIPADATKGFLPPNNAAHDGEGAVSYTISAKTSAPTGATISARADVIFDANPAISTPTETNTLDAVAPQSHVTLPTTAGTEFTVHWGGTDDAGGSGLAFYDVYVKDDNVAGSAFHPFVQNTAHTAGIFTGLAGHTYEFFSVSRDGAGNVEAQPLTGQGSVTLVQAPTYAISAGHPGVFVDALGKTYAVSLTGPGTATLTFENGAASAAHADVRSLVLNGTTAASSLTIAETKGGSVHVGRIEAGSANLGAITLGAGVILGDGADDAATDLHVGGALGKLTLADLNNHALVNVGDQVASTLVAKVAPLPVTFGKALGDDVQLHFATRVGAVRATSWAFAGSLQADLGAASLTVLTGDLVAAVEVAAGSLGPVTVAGGNLANGSLHVSGTLVSLSVKGQVTGRVAAGAIGSVVVGGLTGATLLAELGGIGPIVSKGPIVDSLIEADLGKITSLAVGLAAQTGAVTAIDTATVTAASIGNVTVSLAGAAGLTFARGIEASTFIATTGALGNVTALVSGAGLQDGVAIEGSAFTAQIGSIGNIAALVSSAHVAPGLAALRATNLTAGANLGNITAVASATNLHPTGGAVSAIADVDTDSQFIAGGSIGAFAATASGSSQAVAIGVFEGQRFTVSAGTSIASIAITTNAAAGKDAFGVSRASFQAGTNIGPVVVSGAVNGTQVFDTSIIAGGRIASVAISARDGVDGTLAQSTIIAGRNHALATAADLVLAGLGTVTVTGSIFDSQIVAAGSLTGVTVTRDLTTSLIAAGDQVGADRVALTADDRYTRAASLGTLRVGGFFGTTSVVAGIDPGADHTFGGTDDALGAVLPGLATVGRLGAIVLGASNANTGITNPFLTSPSLPHAYAIESALLTSVTIGKLKPLTVFTAPVELSQNGSADSAHDLIRSLAPH